MWPSLARAIGTFQRERSFKIRALACRAEVVATWSGLFKCHGTLAVSRALAVAPQLLGRAGHAEWRARSGLYLFFIVSELRAVQKARNSKTSRFLSEPSRAASGVISDYV